MQLEHVIQVFGILKTLIDQLDILKNQINVLVELQIFSRKIISTLTGGRSPNDRDDGDNGDDRAGLSGHVGEKDAQTNANVHVVVAKDDQTDVADKEINVVKDAAEDDVDEAVKAATQVDTEEEVPENENIADNKESPDE